MSEKVILILVDGMRPDGIEKCGHPFIETLKKISSYTMEAKTVWPSVTLPCHMSLFHSVDPSRHGITTNLYMPQVRPIDGLFDVLHAAGKKNAFFYSWEQLRDISRPGHLHKSLFLNIVGNEHTDIKLTDEAILYIKEENPDFTFLYLGETDDFGGHKYGWMSKEYLKCVNTAVACMEKVYKNLPDDYTMIVTADHGGHDRVHGHESYEDMTIPLFISGPRFEKGEKIENVSIKDIAVTIADLLEVKPAKEWEGKSLLK
ncbi:MAG: alkaline phosphatase family protein [Clostridia bacterium]|nr:alkaline phosphatase family protein [Clostridia bacterium]